MTEAQFLEQYCAQLNDQQLEAVRAVDGAVLLLAVPGSGKTTVLVTRLGYMVCCCGIRPENILTMTYTVAATREMGARFTRLFGSTYGSAMEIRTINGLSQKIIDRYSQTENRAAFALLDDEGALSGMVREIYRQYYSDYPSENVIRDIRTAITYCKNSMFGASEIREYDMGLKYFPDIYRDYCDSLRSQRRMDYDDQLLYALNILKTRPQILTDYRQQYRYLCVDESQDTSRLQHEIIRLLAGKNGNLFMVGDEDQSIYGFRAACPEALVRFSEDYPGARTLVMEQNYRSTEEITGAANRFVAENRFRHPKQIQPTRGSGLPVRTVITTGRMAQHRYLYGLAERGDRSLAILSRNNDSLVPLIDLFERRGIGYGCRQFDGTFFSHRILQDIGDIIRFSTEECSCEIFMRIYHKLGCMISRTAAEYACRESVKTGKPILRELIRCPELGQFSMGAITALYDAMKQLPGDNAQDALNRIRYQIGYGEYVERNKLDAGKFPILDMVAEPLPSAAALLDRLEELRLLIRDHVNPPDAKVTLSTIHSSKGLEYDNVYLLDVLDGILPGKTAENAKSQEEIRQYEEERRLCYVGMTRAKKELTLFVCEGKPSEFVSEILGKLPEEHFDDRDFLAALRGNFCGKRYHHRELGSGRIIAQGEEGLLVEFADGEDRLFTLDELIQNRLRQMGKAEKKPEAQAPKTAPVGELNMGCRAEHISYGCGTVTKMDLETITVCFDSDGRERAFLRSAVIPSGKLKPLSKG